MPPVRRNTSTRICIAFAIRSLDVGGISRQLLKLVRSIDNSRYAAHILVIARSNHRLLNQFQELNVSVHLGNFHKKNPCSVLWIAYLIRKFRFELIHSFLARADILVCVAAVLCGYKNVICTEHGNQRVDYSSCGFRQRLLDRAITFRVATYISACSDYSRRVLRQIGCPALKLVVIRNGISEIDPERLAGAETRNKQLGSCKVVGMVARLHPVKAPQVFLSTAVKVLRSLPNSAIRFVLVGSGPMERDFQNSVRRLGDLSGSILLVGFHPNPEEWISAFDVCVLTSFSESFLIAC